MSQNNELTEDEMERLAVANRLWAVAEKEITGRGESTGNVPLVLLAAILANMIGKSGDFRAAVGHDLVVAGFNMLGVPISGFDITSLPGRPAMLH